MLDLDDANVLQIPPFDAMGTPRAAHQGSSATGADFEHAVHELQSALYQEAA